MPPALTRLPRRLLAVLVVAALLPSAAQARWTEVGHGFGHGIGLSAYGAYGYAKRGVGYRAILAHYYTGTGIDDASGRIVRVLVGTAGGDASFSHATAACGRDLNPSHSYRAHRRGGEVRLLSGSGKPLAKCGSRLHADGAQFVDIQGAGKFRGSFEAVPGGSGLDLVNALDVDAYARGVVPKEVPPSWPTAALQAQAVAARSIGLTSDAGGKAFDVYNDTRSQVYGGLGAETKRTNQAVSSTAGEVVSYKGHVATAYYSSCSGGKTENIEFAFIGAAPVPYLKGVIDPYDGACPLHDWSTAFNPSSLAGYFSGRFQGLKVLKHGFSPRIVSALVQGSGGSRKVRGDTLASTLGAYSSWLRIRQR